MISFYFLLFIFYFLPFTVYFLLFTFLTPTGVKKLDENEGGCIDNGLKLIPLMNPEKIGINLKPKSARKSREKVVKPVIESLVGRPNPENDFLSKGTGSQENTKRRKKKLKN